MCTNKTISKRATSKRKTNCKGMSEKNVQKSFKTTTSMQSSLHWFLLHWTCDAIKSKTNRGNLKFINF
mgnify:CR=1 FL=1